jgi:hypothetical protein
MVAEVDQVRDKTRCWKTGWHRLKRPTEKELEDMVGEMDQVRDQKTRSWRT